MSSRNNKRINLFSLALLAALALTSCSTPAPKFEKPTKPGLSLVFGHIDMKDAPTGIRWVDMRRVRPVAEKDVYYFWVVDGTFLRSHVPEGTYKLTQFGGGKYTYSFPAQGKGDLDRQITKPGVYYVGSYKYKKIPRGLFRDDQFDLIPTDSPSELELLKKISVYSRDDYWKDMIEKRIRELEK